MTVTGETLRAARAAARPMGGPHDHRGAQNAARAAGRPGRAVGNIAPQGDPQRSAADSKLFEHEGRAIVFSSLEDLAARIDDPKLDVEPEDILVLQNAGPRPSAAMPEAGYLPIPKKLAAKGLKDMIRVSDARMSGTAVSVPSPCCT